MTIPPGASVGRPGVVKPVALYLEGPTGTAQLVAHFLEKSLEWRLLYCYQFASNLVTRIMLTAET